MRSAASEANKQRAALLALATLLTLAGCSKGPDTGSTTKKDEGDKTKTATKSDDASKTSETADAGKSDATKTATTSAVTKSPNGQVKINMNELPEDVVIVNVGSAPIKVGEYRRMLKLEQVQLNKSIATNPGVQRQLLQVATQKGISLTSEEREKIIAQAKQEHARDGMTFEQFLKEKKISEAQYNDEINKLGVMYKTANMILEQELLTQLVTREILSKAAKDAGWQGKANSAYDTAKKSQEYPKLKKDTGFSDDLLKAELVKGELAKMMIDKITQSIKISDADVKAFYNKNKAQLKHNERVRLASILVLASEKDDVGGYPSLHAILKKQNPKMSETELAASVAQLAQQQKQKALLVLGRAIGGEDFAKLANENSDDPNVRLRHSGGDMGWLEKKQLDPSFASAVWGLKSGKVLEKMIKTPVGYQIVKVVAHEPAGTMSMADVKPLLEAKLRQDKSQQAVAKYVLDQKNKMQVQFSPKFVALSQGVAAPAATPQ